ncbi:ABC transporter permease [Sphingomicrobium astaxanthinifaciens]|uniref:ABC transporter permease n=1 Tax=Sphingomicrobium astaxanthinifaciens TaxID=1227949 RepID=UPI001FCAB620|nr:FtsX-like permease family protein [Sphingomicrobium astaxanthinifaciens]MCJ7421000.1 ABC transporter permease [Sphingomicrobium astaxanthinifaciens]
MIGWQLARRDLKGGRAGLGLLFACLLLSIAGLAAVLSLVAAMNSAIDANGRALLGGDLLVSQAQRPASDAEREAMAALGTVSEGVATRAMLRQGSDIALVDLRGVDAAFPLAGEIALAGRRPERGDEIALGRAVARQLGLELGDRTGLGNADYAVVGLIDRMPGGTFLFAPPALLTPEGLARSGLVVPGSLVDYQYRIALDDPAALDGAEERLLDALEPIGWEATTREGASRGTQRFVGLAGDMLLVVAIAALGIGALGIGAAMRAFATSRQAAVARLKLVGAQRRDLAAMLGLEIAAAVLLALLPALAIGAAVPPLLEDLLADRFPVAPDTGPHWGALLLAGGIAVAVTLMVAWRPLVGALRTAPKALLRADAGSGGLRGKRSDWIVPTLAALVAVALLLLGSDNLQLAALAIAALVGLSLLFWLLGWLVQRAARGAKGRGGPIARLGVAALHRPGNATRALTVALGLGLSILVALAATSQSLLGELDGAIPDRAPSHFITDLPRDAGPQLEALVAREIPSARLRVVPSLRGSISAVDGIAVDELPEERRSWLTSGDRGLTYAAQVPEGNRVSAGAWWAEDYAGPPLVSLEEEAARDLQLEVGDTLTLSIAGREVTAAIASLREVDWRSFGFNFGIVFAPGTLERAPHVLMATIEPQGAAIPPGFEARLAAVFPTASTISVSGVLEDVRSVLTALDAAVRIATLLAILIGVVVLTGSVLATRAARARDLVLLRLVGARRRQLLGTQLVEFAILVAAAVLLAIGAGLGVAWFVATDRFEIAFRPDATAIAGLALATVAVAIGSAMAAVRPALTRSPSAALRAH